MDTYGSLLGAVPGEWHSALVSYDVKCHLERSICHLANITQITGKVTRGRLAHIDYHTQPSDSQLELVDDSGSRVFEERRIIV